MAIASETLLTTTFSLTLNSIIRTHLLKSDFMLTRTTHFLRLRLLFNGDMFRRDPIFLRFLPLVVNHVAEYDPT